MEYRKMRGGYNANYHNNKVEKIYIRKKSSETTENQQNKKEEISESIQHPEKHKKNKFKEEKKAI